MDRKLYPTWGLSLSDNYAKALYCLRDTCHTSKHQSEVRGEIRIHSETFYFHPIKDNKIFKHSKIDKKYIVFRDIFHQRNTCTKSRFEASLPNIFRIFPKEEKLANILFTFTLFVITST